MVGKMFIKIGFLGHVFQVSFGPEEEVWEDDGGWVEEEIELLDGITGGPGGSFERFVETPVEEEWEFEDRAGRFGFG